MYGLVFLFKKTIDNQLKYKKNISLLVKKFFVLMKALSKFLKLLKKIRKKIAIKVKIT